MFGLTAATRIYLYRGRCDMRKSFDGLCGIISLVNRRRSFYWDRVM